MVKIQSSRLITYNLQGLFMQMFKKVHTIGLKKRQEENRNRESKGKTDVKQMQNSFFVRDVKGVC